MRLSNLLVAAAATAGLGSAQLTAPAPSADFAVHDFKAQASNGDVVYDFTVQGRSTEVNRVFPKVHCHLSITGSKLKEVTLHKCSGHDVTFAFYHPGNSESTWQLAVTHPFKRDGVELQDLGYISLGKKKFGNGGKKYTGRKNFVMLAQAS